jgi:hypothetical protein
VESSGPDRSRGPEGLRGLTSPRLRGVIILVALVPLVSSLWDKLSVLRMGRLGRRSDDQAPHEAALGEQSRWAHWNPTIWNPRRRGHRGGNDVGRPG